MRIATLFFYFMISICSHQALAQKIQGQYLCEEVHPDGSSQMVLLKIYDKKMAYKIIDLDFIQNYQEIYTAQNQEKGYSVFSVSDDTASDDIIILAPSSKKPEQMMMTIFDTEKWYNKAYIANGYCKRI